MSSTPLSPRSPGSELLRAKKSLQAAQPAVALPVPADPNEQATAWLAMRLAAGWDPLVGKQAPKR